jgi:V8-like Glu-specific endopeptidase
MASVPCRANHRMTALLKSVVALPALFVCLVGMLRADERLDAEVLKKVKQATVYLRVTLPDKNVVQGSGFFGVEPGLVLTNAHVLGMLRPESQPPTRVEVVLNSGEKNEQMMLGKVLGVDQDTDLAVIRVGGKGLPEPLKLGTAKNLKETDTVFIFGYPFGKELGKNVTVSKSSVSSLRKELEGTYLKQIQVNGGMHPGNSGGPLTDEKGQVVGIAVSGIRTTTINFAVPVDQVNSLVRGRTWNHIRKAPYKDGDKVKVPVELVMIDPLRRVREIWYETWTGDPGKERNPRLVKPERQPGDSEHEKTVLTYKDGVAQGELTFPPIPKGKVFWIQAVFINGAGQTTWSTARVMTIPPPVERRPAVVAYKHQPGTESQWKLTTTSTLKLRDEDDVDHPLGIILNAALSARTGAKLDGDKAALDLKLSSLDLSVTFDKKSVGDTKDDTELKKELQLVAPTLQVGPDGNLVGSSADLKRLPKTAQKKWQVINERLVQSLEAAMLPLPGKEVATGKPWKGTRTLPVGTIGPPQPVQADITYTYLGVRVVGGREYGVIDFTGDVRGEKSKLLHVGGRVKGESSIDLATGQVTRSSITVDLDLSMLIDGHTECASGTLDIRLERTLPGK